MHEECVKVIHIHLDLTKLLVWNDHTAKTKTVKITNLFVNTVQGAVEIVI